MKKNFIKDTQTVIKRVTDAIEEHPDLMKKENSVAGQIALNWNELKEITHYKPLRDKFVKLLKNEKIASQTKAKEYLLKVEQEFDKIYNRDTREGSRNEYEIWKKLLFFISGIALKGANLGSPDSKKEVHDALPGNEIAKKVAEIFNKENVGNGYYGDEKVKAKGNSIYLFSMAGDETVTFNDDGSVDIKYNFEDDDEAGKEHFASFNNFIDKMVSEQWFWWYEVDWSEYIEELSDISDVMYDDFKTEVYNAIYSIINKFRKSNLSEKEIGEGLSEVLAHSKDFNFLTDSKTNTQAKNKENNKIYGVTIELESNDMSSEEDVKDTAKFFNLKVNIISGRKFEFYGKMSDLIDFIDYYYNSGEYFSSKDYNNYIYEINDSKTKDAGIANTKLESIDTTKEVENYVEKRTPVKDDNTLVHEMCVLLGRAHDAIIEAQDLVGDLESEELVDSSLGYDIEDVEAALSDLDFMGNENPEEALLEKYGYEEY